MKKIRLDKFLSDLGFGSRKEVKKLIKQKRVQVNDRTVNNPSFTIDIQKDSVYLDGELLQYNEHHYYMFNKPSGYITAKEDKTHPVVMEFFEDNPFYRKLFPVGRLDIDTEGLLLITDDGQLSHRIAHPKWEVEKEYYAVVKGDISSEKLDRYEKEGIKFKNFTTKPFKIKVLSSSPEKSEILITVKEGKHHIVKKIMEKIGYPVLYLKRIRIGNLKLDESLEPGEYRELTEEELKNLKKLVNL
ncbi:16S rRNA pseudouridine516 synthase [Persephonella hydrogeniphila]|uniref:Pseudouridine synthase n=1 Tax=Persephonella hydrogeniphila TaxID=198703 RepID=A0A285NE78_9AQUI|nr:pseudouridine synthase [Persephonella hydrogeniphila]SNZ07804.1 16S rRNA pseudouridine516 synthase [Persephonella hydrogeniphila]